MCALAQLVQVSVSLQDGERMGQALEQAEIYGSSSERKMLIGTTIVVVQVELAGNLGHGLDPVGKIEAHLAGRNVKVPNI